MGLLVVFGKSGRAGGQVGHGVTVTPQLHLGVCELYTQTLVIVYDCRTSSLHMNLRSQVSFLGH